MAHPGMDNQDRAGQQAIHCPRCGYDVRFLPQNRCPECGETFDPQQLLLKPVGFPWKYVLQHALCGFLLTVLLTIGGVFVGESLAPGSHGPTLFTLAVVGVVNGLSGLTLGLLWQLQRQELLFSLFLMAVGLGVAIAVALCAFSIFSIDALVMLGVIVGACAIIPFGLGNLAGRCFAK